MDFNIKISSDGKLLEKLSEAAGWVTYGSTDFRRAKKTFIDEVQTMDISLFEKAALISNAGKIIKEYRNQQEIVKYAMQVIDGDISPDRLDDEWLIQFMDYAKQISSEDFQKIWGTILAREAQEKDSKKVQVGDVIYTKRGTAMYKALSHESTEIDGFWEEICLPMFCKANSL